MKKGKDYEEISHCENKRSRQQGSRHTKRNIMNRLAVRKSKNIKKRREDEERRRRKQKKPRPKVSRNTNIKNDENRREEQMTINKRRNYEERKQRKQTTR